jgi:hypothetical protein
VSFSIAARHTPVPRTVTTDASGHATACYKLRPNTRLHVLATAQHPYYTELPAKRITLYGKSPEAHVDPG